MIKKAIAPVLIVLLVPVPWAFSGSKGQWRCDASRSVSYHVYWASKTVGTLQKQTNKQISVRIHINGRRQTELQLLSSRWPHFLLCNMCLCMKNLPRPSSYAATNFGCHYAWFNRSGKSSFYHRKPAQLQSCSYAIGNHEGLKKEKKQGLAI